MKDLRLKSYEANPMVTKPMIIAADISVNSHFITDSLIKVLTAVFLAGREFKVKNLLFLSVVL